MTIAPRMPVRSPDIVRRQIIERHDTYGLSYRKIARSGEFGKIPAGTLCAIAKGYDIPKRWRVDLGLFGEATVFVVIPDGEVPPGTQVLTASVCECGQPFISNHPARKRCFICSPYKSTKKVIK